MSRYTVTRLIKSALNLGGSCEIDGITFDPIEPFRADEGLLVSGQVQNTGFRDAIASFDRHLLVVADAVTVVTGALVHPAAGSTLVQKTRSRYALLIAVKRRPSASLTLVPGHFNQELLDGSSDTAALLASDSRMRDAAHFLRQAASTENLTTSTFHTLQAAEAMTRKGTQEIAEGAASASRLRPLRALLQQRRSTRPEPPNGLGAWIQDRRGGPSEASQGDAGAAVG
jgi:hypothetical protein